MSLAAIQDFTKASHASRMFWRGCGSATGSADLGTPFFPHFACHARLDARWLPLLGQQGLRPVAPKALQPVASEARPTSSEPGAYLVRAH